MRRTLSAVVAAVVTTVAVATGPVGTASASPTAPAAPAACAPTDLACLLLAEVEALLAPVTELVNEVGAVVAPEPAAEGPVASAAAAAPGVTSLLPPASLSTGQITPTGSLGGGSLSRGTAGPVAPVGEALTLAPLAPPDFGILGFDRTDLSAAPTSGDDEVARAADVTRPADGPDNALALAVVTALSGLLLAAGLLVRKLRPAVLPFT